MNTGVRGAVPFIILNKLSGDVLMNKLCVHLKKTTTGARDDCPQYWRPPKVTCPLL